MSEVPVVAEAGKTAVAEPPKVEVKAPEANIEPIVDEKVFELQFQKESLERELNELKNDEAFKHLITMKQVLSLKPENRQRTRDFLAQLSKDTIPDGTSIEDMTPEQKRIQELTEQVSSLMEKDRKADENRSLETQKAALRKDWGKIEVMYPELKNPILKKAVLFEYKEGGTKSLLEVAKSVMKEHKLNPLSANVIPTETLQKLKEAPAITAGAPGSATEPPKYKNVTEAMEAAAARVSAG